MAGPLGYLNNFMSHGSAFFESNMVTSQIEKSNAEIEQSIVEKNKKMTENTINKNEQEALLDGAKKLSELQMQF